MARFAVLTHSLRKPAASPPAQIWAQKLMSYGGWTAARLHSPQEEHERNDRQEQDAHDPKRVREREHVCLALHDPVKDSLCLISGIWAGCSRSVHCPGDLTKPGLISRIER